ncbi:MAG: lysophospholipase [Bacteroidota bacterium]
MIHQEFNFNLNQTKLYGQYFEPKTVNAVVVLVHGMGEHSSRYKKYVIPELNKISVAVVTFDHFGHGKTEGKRGHNPGYDAVLNSISYVLEKSKELFGEKPTLLYGHSMGGNAVINYTLRRKNDFKGVIATSPFLRLSFEPPKWKLNIAKALLKIYPSFIMDSGLDVNAISRDKKAVEAYINDPLNHDKVSPNFSIPFIESGKWAIENAQKLNVPMLLMHGTGDQLTSYKASQEFAKNSKNVDLKLFENAYHELHNDIIKEDAVGEIINWINKNLT